VAYGVVDRVNKGMLARLLISDGVGANKHPVTFQFFVNLVAARFALPDARLKPESIDE
jgi:hypothetical protein